MVPLASHPQGTSGPREYFRNDDGQEGGRTSGNVMGGNHFRQLARATSGNTTRTSQSEANFRSRRANRKPPPPAGSQWASALQRANRGGAVTVVVLPGCQCCGAAGLVRSGAGPVRGCGRSRGRSGDRAGERAGGVGVAAAAGPGLGLGRASASCRRRHAAARRAPGLLGAQRGLHLRVLGRRPRWAWGGLGSEVRTAGGRGGLGSGGRGSRSGPRGSPSLTGPEDRGPGSGSLRSGGPGFEV